MLANLYTVALLTHGHGPWDSDYWWVWRLGMFVLWILVLACIFFAFRRWGWRGYRPDPLDQARSVLAERFARGEISAEEYHERLGQLR